MKNLILFAFIIFSSHLFCTTLTVQNVQASCGETNVPVEIYIDDATGLSAFEFNLYFDGTKLQSVSAQKTTLTDGFTLLYTNHTDYIRVAAATGFPLSSGTGAICVIYFNVIATTDGSSNLDLQNSLVNDIPPTEVDGIFTITNCCSEPTGMPNNTASDLDECADTGVQINWTDPTNWGDLGGTRNFVVLRNGTDISGNLSSSTHTFTDTTGTNGAIYNYQVKAINGCGKSHTTAGAQAADNVLSAPTCSESPNPQDGATGVSTTPTLTWSSVSGATSYDVYFGTSSNPPYATNKTTTSYSPGTLNPNTTYYWKIVPKNSCGSATGCQVWSFTTGSEPLSCTANANPSSGNAPLTVNFTSSASGGNSPYTFNWDFGDGGSSNQQNTTHTYQNPGTYYWSLTVTDSMNNNCYKNGTINVSSSTSLTCTAEANPTSGKAPLEVHFTSSVSGGTTPYSYYWNFGDGQTSNEQNPVHTYISEGNYNWTFTVTDSSNSTCQKEGTIVVSEEPVEYSDNFIVPAGAHSEGAYGSFWKTDLSICNFSSSTQNINIALLKAGQNNTNPQNFNITIYKNSCAGFDDIFYEKFNYEGAGALKISGNTEKLKINSRTYNDAPEGTYGQFIPGFHKNNLLTKGENGYLAFLQKNENFRTNIGFSSLSENYITINLKLYNSNGDKIGEKDISLEPYGYRQENDIFGQFGLNNIYYAYAIVKSETDGAFYTSYASVVDNKSNDPVFIPVEK